MSSRTSPSSTDDDDLRDMLNAMGQPSPIAPSRNGADKRTHEAMTAGNSDDDAEPHAATSPAFALANPNIVAAARRCGERKRLCAEQVTDVDVFLRDPASLREVKLLTNLFAIGNSLEKIVTATRGYEVSAELKKNIKSYAPTVLLSSKINDYKGDVPKKILLAILKKYRFDIPPGLENIPADWEKIVDVVQDALTQERSNIKKKIVASCKLHKSDKTHAPADKQQNIFNLTARIVKGTKSSRSVLLKFPGSNYWDKVDERLATIRAEADGDAKKIIKGFRYYLEVDQRKHGVKDYELDEKTVDSFQQEVDDLIDAGAIDTATSAHDNNTNNGGGGGGGESGDAGSS
ncbi:hypothetical protein B0H17DRAFT_1199556 [Mycena rosella]|uniref:Uncharacterized protein n=1 Tax=Mycena rosella TaxID=1033263 RepID=A0AAD7DNM7_MYCRO|nr:hypothetical protein B0H17DRAFT_1199556 [Mycena rosella]